MAAPSALTLPKAAGIRRTSGTSVPARLSIFQRSGSRMRLLVHCAACFALALLCPGARAQGPPPPPAAPVPGPVQAAQGVAVQAAPDPVNVPGWLAAQVFLGQQMGIRGQVAV